MLFALRLAGRADGLALVHSADQAKDYAAKMIGNKLITKQTGAGGRVVNAVGTSYSSSSGY